MIVLKLTQAQFNALISSLNTLNSVMGECPTTQKEKKLINRMLLNNGYENKQNK